jgi:hypothetical protein
MGTMADLNTLAHDFLEAMEDALETVPLFDPTLLGPPPRSYVSPGLPVWDCPEQLTVYVTPVVDLDTAPGGLGALKRVRVAHVTTVQIIGTITRCVPTGAENQLGNYVMPTEASLEAAAKQINHDGWALWNHVWSLVHAGQLLTLCQGAIFEGMSAVIPSGGSAGWEIRIRAELDGYEETPLGS